MRIRAVFTLAGILGILACLTLGPCEPCYAGATLVPIEIKEAPTWTFKAPLAYSQLPVEKEFQNQIAPSELLACAGCVANVRLHQRTQTERRLRPGHRLHYPTEARPRSHPQHRYARNRVNDHLPRAFAWQS